MRIAARSENAKKEEENIAQWKHRFKMTGPYEVLNVRSAIVKINYDVLPVTVSIYRCGTAPDDMKPYSNEVMNRINPD